MGATTTFSTSGEGGEADGGERGCRDEQGEGTLVKHDVRGAGNCTGDRVENAVRLHVRLVSHEDHWQALVVELLATGLGVDEGAPGATAKNAEMGDVDWGTRPDRVGNRVPGPAMRSLVLHVYESQRRLGPKLLGNSRVREQGDDPFCEVRR